MKVKVKSLINKVTQLRFGLNKVRTKLTKGHSTDVARRIKNIKLVKDTHNRDS